MGVPARPTSLRASRGSVLPVRLQAPGPVVGLVRSRGSRLHVVRRASSRGGVRGVTPKNADPRSSDTRERIIAATLQTLEQDGFAETSARAIARNGGFNQALIFYHFGSIAQVLIEAFREVSDEQTGRY